MITKDNFNILINNHLAWDKRIDSVCKVLDCDIFDADWVEYSNTLFTRVLHILFTDDAVETITWWMYEHTDKDKDAMWDETGKVIPMKTVEDLWNFVKDERK